MNDLIEPRREALIALCHRYRVRRLDVFGSAASGEFDVERSDLDFLVTFDELPPRDHADAYFGLLDGLRSLFGRPVDLVEAGAIRNPYFLESVSRTRTVLYAA
jgi:predicted nucleotidyltransferase